MVACCWGSGWWFVGHVGIRACPPGLVVIGGPCVSWCGCRRGLWGEDFVSVVEVGLQECVEDLVGQVLSKRYVCCVGVACVVSCVEVVNVAADVVRVSWLDVACLGLVVVAPFLWSVAEASWDGVGAYFRLFCVDCLLLGCLLWWLCLCASRVVCGGCGSLGCVDRGVDWGGVCVGFFSVLVAIADWCCLGLLW